MGSSRFNNICPFFFVGMISTWFVDGKIKPAAQSSSYGSNSRSATTVVKWNSNGRRLITGDEVNFIFCICVCDLNYIFILEC